MEKDENGSTPLHLAVASGHKDVILKLLESCEGQTAKHMKDNKGDTPWNVAGEKRDTSIVQLLDNPKPAASNSEVANSLSCPVCFINYSTKGMKCLSSLGITIKQCSPFYSIRSLQEACYHLCKWSHDLQ